MQSYQSNDYYSYLSQFYTPYNPYPQQHTSPVLTANDSGYNSSFFSASPTSTPSLATSKRTISQLEHQPQQQQQPSSKKSKILKLDNASDPATTYRCTLCECEFNSAARFLLHQSKFHLKRDSRECPICSMYKRTKLKLKQKNFLA